MDGVVKVTGLSDLQIFMDDLAPKLVNNILRGAVRAGLQPIKEQAAADCPVGPPSGTGAHVYKLYEGALRDSLHITTRSRADVVTGRLILGGKAKHGALVWYANLIERTGAIAHIIRSRKGSALNIAGKEFSLADHPGMAPKPFFRHAADSRAEAAVVAFGEYIKDRLATKQGLDTAYINVAGDA